MQIEAWDEVFIRCRRDTVNALVCDVPGWSRWWPGLSVDALDVGRDVGRDADQGVGRFDLVVRPPARLPWLAQLSGLAIRRGLTLPSAQHLRVTVDRIRPRDKGIEMSIAGDVHGSGEWFHLDHPDGVVVNYLLRGELTGGNARRWLAAHRASVRVALTDLKRRLEAARTPGAEPHPVLLSHQAEEMAIFAREVAAHEAELATSAAERAGTSATGSRGAASPDEPASSAAP